MVWDFLNNYPFLRKFYSFLADYLVKVGHQNDGHKIQGWLIITKSRKEQNHVNKKETYGRGIHLFIRTIARKKWQYRCR
jgi:hypothetical protein